MTFPSETSVMKILTPQNERMECDFCRMEKKRDYKGTIKFLVFCQDENQNYFLKCLKCRRESNHYMTRREASAAWARSVEIVHGCTKCIATAL